MPRKQTELSGVLNCVYLGSSIITDTESKNTHSKKKKKVTKKKVSKKTVLQDTVPVSNNTNTLNKITNSVTIIEDTVDIDEDTVDIDEDSVNENEDTVDIDEEPLENVTKPLENVDSVPDNKAIVSNPGEKLDTVPVSSTRTKRLIHPSVHWMFTYNNPPDDFVQLISILPQVKRFVVQKEKGELRGTEHLQGYIEFAIRTRPKTVIDWTSNIHWTKAKCVPEAIAYCQKKETRIAGPWYKGIVPQRPLCTLTDGMLFPWQKKVIDIISSEPHDRKIFWFWEPEGNSGKTTFCKYLAIHYGACILGGKSADMKNAIASMAKYPQIIVIDVPRASFDYISYQGIEEIKNGMFFSGKYESKMVIGPVPHLIVFANETPDTDKLSADRWELIRI